MDSIDVTPLQRMLSWRATSMKVFMLVAFLGIVWTNTSGTVSGLGPILQVSLALLALLTLFVWYELFRCSLVLGGAGYAVAHLGLAIALTPLFYLGVIVVPLLVESDVTKGVAGYNRKLPQLTLAQMAQRWIALVAGLGLGWPIYRDSRGLSGVLVALLVALVATKLLERGLSWAWPTRAS